MKKIDKVRIIPLGGLDEIGKNLTLFECGKDIIAVDCGLHFPDDELPGVDYVIADTQYIVRNFDRFAAIFITHGHEDHIGGIPYLLKDINVPIYGTPLTLGILANKLKEFNLETVADLREVNAGDTVECGTFSVEFIHVNHSIADACALAIRTPCGLILHMGDFKIDVSPINGEMIDIARLGEIGRDGVLCLLMDSTNVERPGFAMSERKVGETLNNIFRKANKQRIIVATFASNVDRVQQIIDNAVEFDRKVVIVGRSMVSIVNVAKDLGYMNIPEGVLVDLSDINHYPPEKLVIITTGSQGEPMSALYRMAYSEHKSIEITPGDLVVISAHAIPGNEKLVNRVVNELYRSGANVVYENFAEVHVSGHACQEELKLILALTKPRYFIPVHGEIRHLKKHASLAHDMGIPSNRIVVTENGSIVELDAEQIKVVGNVPAGKILVDGLGVGDVGSVVLRDRKHLAQDGLLVIVIVVDEYTQTLLTEPEIISRGFAYLKENQELSLGLKTLVEEIIDDSTRVEVKDWLYSAKNRIKTDVSKYIFDRTKRNPIILPVVKGI